MSKELLKMKRSFESKISTLDKAKEQLKKEFVGIDSAIEEVIDNVRSWYTLGNLQNKPCVVNLWGLTGVGKSSLLLRLSELLNITDKTFRVDLGEKKSEYAINSSLEEIADISGDEQIIIILDEIQHARTLKGTLYKEEIEKDSNRIIWELIDSGRISINKWDFKIKLLMKFTILIEKLIEDGMQIQKGKATTKNELFIKERDEVLNNKPSTNANENELAIPDEFHKLILDYIDEKYQIKYIADVRSYLKTLDEVETLKLLKHIVRNAQKPLIKHFRKALVFVVGNIDEAYRFNGNFTADISADEFYELSKKINVPIIKNALRERFRDEQIARLGNSHIIYPAFNEKSYREIIRLNLNNYFKQLEKEYNIKWTYNDSLVEKIYREGVYPAQGARPVFTTIHQIVKAKTALLLQSILVKEKPIDFIKLSVSDEKLIGSFYYDNTKLWEEGFEIPSHLDKLRKPKKDEMQAIVAVHESGHAVLHAALLQQSPQCITSVSSDSKSEGFVFTRDKADYTPKNELIKKVAIKLGGLVAEKIVFGEEHITLGSASDISKVHDFLGYAIKQSGMGKKYYGYALSESQDTHRIHSIKDAENEIKIIIDEGKLLAEKTLITEKKVLVKLAMELSQRSRIEKEEFEKLYNKYATYKVDFDEESTFYRDSIKRALNQITVNSSIIQERAIILNKHNEFAQNVLNSSHKTDNHGNPEIG